jgi:hypothetical protein
MITWYLNDVEISTLGLSIIGGQKRSHGVSSINIKRAANFDAAHLLAYDADVVISYVVDDADPVIYFQGKCKTPNRYGSAREESQSYTIEDAWSELESTIYQESWGFGELEDEEDRVHLRVDKRVPKAVFGMDATGADITVGAQITNAIGYAASAGVAIQVGSIPAGEVPLQTDLMNVSVAEVIQMSLRYHPDWFPWIDHSTTPPTLNVSEVSAMTAANIPVDGSGEEDVEFEVIERSDRIPSCVRITYEFAGEANVDGDPEIFRKLIIDKFPTDGPDEGPKVLCSVVPLQGMTMQGQKSRLHCRTIPTSQETAKAWLKLHYVHLADIPDAEFNVTGWGRKMLEEPDDHPAPINPRAIRLDHDEDPDKYPRELVRGSIEDWMRVRVGRMLISPTVKAAAGASEATKEALAKGTPPFPITATNARNKIYFGPSQWVAPEDVPSGIAASVYASIVAAAKYEGSFTFSSEEMPLTQFVGKKVNFTGSDSSELTTMGAPVNSMSWDIESGQVSVNFGPPNFLSPNDFLEFQRLLARAQPVAWWSASERTEDKYGSELKPSRSGDTVSGFDQPMPPPTPPSGSMGPFWPTVRLVGEVLKATLTKGFVNERIPGETTPAKVHEAAHNDDEFTMTVGQQLTLEVAVGKDGKVDLAASEPVAVVVTTEDAASVHFRPIAGDDRTGVAGTMRYKLAVLREGGANPAFEYFLAGSHIDHWRDIPLIDNSVEDGGTGLARTFWKIDPATGKLLFRTLDKGDGQLRIEEVDGRAKVRGNGKNYVLRIKVGDASATDAATFEDGLCTDEGTNTIEIPEPTLPDDGWWGDLILSFFVNITDSTPYESLKATVENGRIISVAHQAPGGTLTDVPGTEGTPGTGLFSCFATP